MILPFAPLRDFRLGFPTLPGAFLPHRFPLHLDLVGAMHQPVQDAVGNSRVSDLRVPLRHRQLAGQQRRFRLIALIADLQKSPALRVSQRSHRPVVNNQRVHLPQCAKFLREGAIGARQFEQQVRAVCGLPLGNPALVRPAAMANLLGDLWQDGEPNWAAALRFRDVKLHLYGKTHPRPGRKMGHLTALAGTAAEAQDLVVAARDALLA